MIVRLAVIALIVAAGIIVFVAERQKRRRR